MTDNRSVNGYYCSLATAHQRMTHGARGKRKKVHRTENRGYDENNGTMYTLRKNAIISHSSSVRMFQRQKAI